MEKKTGGAARAVLKSIPGLKSGYYLGMALVQMANDQWRRPTSFDRIFAESEDPWESTSEAEQERFQITLSLLDSVSKPRFDRAVEIGCAEGIFTEMLAPRCDSLEALDFSQVALDRAKRRVDLPSVQFRKWNMRKDLLPRGTFDLVVAMGVITSLYRPSDVRSFCGEIIKALEPNGFMLFSDVRQSTVFETAWWGRFMLRGGEQIRRLLTRSKELDVIAVADTKTHVFALYRKTGSR